MRADLALAGHPDIGTRSKANDLIARGLISIDGQVVTKPSKLVDTGSDISILGDTPLVSRAGEKLASVTKALKIDFKNATVLDVGSSTGGFTDYVLRHGASYVIAVDVGTNQMSPKLRGDPRIELHEKTDIRDMEKVSKKIDFVVIDVSFISMKLVLPAVERLVDDNTKILAMVKPQFESQSSGLNKGVIKNSKIRRDILKDFEEWAKQRLVILDSRDSGLAGSKGNVERFYLLKIK